MRLRAKMIAVGVVMVLAGATAIATTLSFLYPRTVPVPDNQNPPACPAIPKDFVVRDSSPTLIDPLPLTTIDKSIWGSPGVPEGAFLIGDTATWEAVWCQTYSSVTTVPPRPDVDFGNATVVAAFLGERQSCGYVVTIHRAFALKEGLVVQLQTYAEEPGFGYCEAFTHPYHFARVPGRWNAAAFEWTRALVDVRFDVAPSAAVLGTNLTFRLDNARRFPALDMDLSNLTLASSAPWVVERSAGGGWVRVEDHPEDATPRTIGPGENASWTWSAIGSSGLPPVVPGIYRARLTVQLSGTEFELTELFRLS